MADTPKDPITPETGDFDVADLEALAAFAEGALDDEERADVVARLAEDEGYDELLQDLLEITGEDGRLLPEITDEDPPADPAGSKAETAAEIETAASPDSETESPPSDGRKAKILQGPWRRLTPWITGLAATALIGLGTFRWLDGDGLRQFESQIARTADFMPDEDWESPIRRFRSEEQLKIDYPTEMDFDLGQISVDLEIAIRLDDLEKLQILTEDNVRVTRAAGLFAGEKLVDIYERIHEDAKEPDVDFEKIRRQNREAQKILLKPSGDRFFFLYGVWARTCQLRYLDPGLTEAPDQELYDFVRRWSDSEDHARYLTKAAEALEADDPEELIKQCRRNTARRSLGPPGR